METNKKVVLSALVVLAFFIVGGAVSGFVENNNEKNRERTGNVTFMRGGPGRMHGISNLFELNLPKNATKAQIREAARKRILEQLGLQVNATDEQIIEATKKREKESEKAIDEAIASGDYNSWKTAVEKIPQGSYIASIISPEKFSKYIELIKAEKKADELRDELGLRDMIKPVYGPGMRPPAMEKIQKIKR